MDSCLDMNSVMSLKPNSVLAVVHLNITRGCLFMPVKTHADIIHSLVTSSTTTECVTPNLTLTLN